MFKFKFTTEPQESKYVYGIFGFQGMYFFYYYYFKKNTPQNEVMIAKPEKFKRAQLD